MRPGEGTEDTRRLATRTEVGEENWDLVTRLANARLVVSSRDEGTREETVEIVHEALIGGWERLRLWIELDRSFRTQVWGSSGEKYFNLLDLKGHRGAVTSVSFSPDGKTIASASEDKTVKLWSVEGAELHTLKGHNGSVTSVSFSSDGKTIASASIDGTIILWNFDLEDLLVRGCDSLRDYVKNNPDVNESYKHLCDGIGTQK